jgi:hypothetical protein
MYSIGTHISFKKNQASELLPKLTLFNIGDKVLFFDWLKNAAVLDLHTA